MYRHVIEVEGRFIDNLTNKADGASESISKIGDKARKSQKDVDSLGKTNATPDVGLDTSKFTQSMDKVNRILDKFKKVHNAALNLKESGTYQKLKKITGAVEGLTKKTWSVVVRAKDLATAPFRAIRNSLFSLQTLATTIFAGIAANQLVMKPVSLGDSIEQSKIAFETKLGSAAAAESFLQKIYKFDEKSPFDTVQIVGIAQQMMNLGWTAENVLEDLGTIGDWSASLGKGTEGISAVTRALGQMRMKGKLSSEEMLQLTEAGVDAWNYVARYVGEDITTIREMAEDGAIDVDTAIRAIMAGLGEYSGAAATQADRTVTGLIDQVKSLFQTYVTLPWGEGLADGLRDGLAAIRDFVDENKDVLKSFGETAKEIGQEISAKFADKVKVAIDRVKEITDSFEFKNADWKGKVSMLWKGLVADPFKEWLSDLWSSEENIQKATEFGKSLAEGITKGILYILGVTDIFAETGDGAEAKGSNIAQGFAKGFVEGFDVSAISDKFVEAIKNVWGALPWWAKTLIVGYGGSKLAIGAGNLISGVANFIGTSGTYEAGKVVGSSGILGVLGKTGVYGVGGSGILGGLSKLGYGASSAIGGTAGKAALLGVGGGTAALAGAGALVTAAGVIKSGVDFYQAYKAHKEGDKTKRDANLASGGATLAGAAVGATIGTFIAPGVGTLIGAGIGTAVGWFAGDKIAKNIEAAAYEAEGLVEPFKDAQTEEEKLAIQTEAMYNNMKRHFGDIKLSASEIAGLAETIVWGDDLAFFEEFSTATKTAEESLQSLKNASAQTNKWMWKAGLNVKFNDDEKASIAASFDEYIASAKSYVENKHYEFTAAANLILDLSDNTGKSILESGNAFYARYEEELESLGEQLSTTLTKALEDGVISSETIHLEGGLLAFSEMDEITNLQQQIAEITEKLSDANLKAELSLIKIKLGKGSIDYDSYQKLLEETMATASTKMDAIDKAYTTVYSSLELQFPDGGEEFDAAVERLVADRDAKVQNLGVEIVGLQLDTTSDAFAKAFGKTGEEMASGLKDALKYAINNKLDPLTLSDDALSLLLDVSAEDIHASGFTAENIRQMLSDVLSNAGYLEVESDLLVKILNAYTYGDTSGLVNEVVDGAVPDSVSKDVVAEITADPEIMNEVTLLAEEFGIEPVQMATVLWELSATKTIPEKLEIIAREFGVEPPYDEDVLLRLTATPTYEKIQLNGNSFLKSTNITATPTLTIAPRLQYVMQNATQGVINSQKASIGANLKKYLPGATQEYRGGFVGGTSSAIEGFAEGGFVRGGARLITVAEEGTPEVIIPLGSHRRQRGLDLWMKAGEMLGVNGFESGRLATGGRDEGIRHHSYNGSGGTVSNDVHVEMGGVQVSISVDARGGENVVEAIKAQSGEIAEAVASILADEIGGQFENTPTRGGAA